VRSTSRLRQTQLRLPQSCRTQDRRNDVEKLDAVWGCLCNLTRGRQADPLGGPIPETANPELAERTRSEYVERFVRVAEAHPGTAAGAVAWLEAGGLQIELGRLDEAVRSFESARDAAGDSAIAALAWTRIAGLAERMPWTLRVDAAGNYSVPVNVSSSSYGESFTGSGSFSVNTSIPVYLPLILKNY